MSCLCKKENNLRNYYYEQLTENEKDIYLLIYKKIRSCKNLNDGKFIIDLTDYFDEGVGHERVFDDFLKDCTVALDSIRKDRPEIFYVKYSQYRIIKNQNQVSMELQSAYETNEIINLIGQLEKLKNDILMAIKADSEEDMLLNLYKYLHKNIVYRNSGKYEHEEHTIVGALVRRCAVCEGIAAAVTYLCRELNIISCITIHGRSRFTIGHKYHAWNMLKTKNATNCLDLTFDLQNKKIHFFNIDPKQIFIDEIPEFDKDIGA